MIFFAVVAMWVAGLTLATYLGKRDFKKTQKKHNRYLANVLKEVV